MTAADPSTMSFGDHLEELRKRLIFSLVGLVPIMIVCLVFGQTILRILIRPLEAQLLRAGQSPTLQALSPVETFGAYVKVSMIATVLIGVPWVLGQFWLFVRPGLYAAERRFARFLMPLSVVLTLTAAAFLYWVMLPTALFFLISFGAGVAAAPPPTAALPEGLTLPALPVLAADPASPEPGSFWFLEPMHQLRLVGATGEIYSIPFSTGGLITQQYRISEYVDLLFLLGVVFAIAFQAPIVVLLLCWSGIVEREDLARQRRMVLMVCAVVAAVVTPTGDPASMLLLTAPLYLLFELGLFLARVATPERVAEGLFTRAVTGRRTDADLDDE